MSNKLNNRPYHTFLLPFRHFLSTSKQKCFPDLASPTQWFVEPRILENKTQSPLVWMTTKNMDYNVMLH